MQRLDAHSSQIAGSMAARHTDLNLQDLTVLMDLGQHGPSRMGDIAKHLGLAPASTTPVVDRLEASAHVARSRSSEDRRVWLVDLSDKGRGAVADIAGIYDQVGAEMLSALSDEEQEAFVALFVKVVGGMGADS